MEGRSYGKHYISCPGYSRGDYCLCVRGDDFKSAKVFTGDRGQSGDTDAFILKEVAADDTDSTYEVVEDDVEFEAVVKIFQELVEDTDFEM